MPTGAAVASDCVSATLAKRTQMWSQNIGPNRRLFDNDLKPLYNLLMLGFKRNQIEEAIAKVLEPRSKEPSDQFLTRLKRLLDVDRRLRRNPRSSDPGPTTRSAFFSADQPGSGVEILFSDYEAFALATALLFIGPGWPQRLAVSILRRARDELETQHDRILKQDPVRLFDEAEIMRNAKVGAIAYDNTDPVLLTVVSTAGQPAQNRSPVLNAQFGEAQWKPSNGFKPRVRITPIRCSTSSTFAHALKDELAKTEPNPRGRSA